MMNRDAIRDKVTACWMGKGIGGAAGMPYEGVPYPLALKGLDVAASQVPNDDLEMQLLWVLAAEKHGAALRARHLSAIRAHYLCYADEYGVAAWNRERGLKPPLTGLHNNAFGDGMGAAIRSEIWACLFPGQPKLAAFYAREDAIVDHHGDGVWGEMFMAAAESAAFAARTPEEALRAGLRHIPRDCRVAKAVSFALGLKGTRLPPSDIRDALLKRFGSPNFTDVAMNLSFIAAALVLGRGDFTRTLVTAINCGMDTDCTGATCGAFLGILRGTRGIPVAYRAAVGQGLVVSECLRSLPLPRTIDETTDRVLALADRLRQSVDRAPKGTPDAARDTVHDHNEWLVFRVPGEEGYATEPAALTAARRNPAGFPRNRHDARGIHLPLDPFIKKDGDILYLMTWLTVPEPLDGQLMVCADTGITVWLDGKQVLNYHGRLKALPAFHRTEGGSSLPITMKPGKPVLLTIRLLGCAAGMSLTAALGEWSCAFVPGARCTLTPAARRP